MPYLGRFLSSRGADLYLLDKYNSTALHIAAYAGNKAISTVLVTEGIDVNARDKVHVPSLKLPSKAVWCESRVTQLPCMWPLTMAMD